MIGLMIGRIIGVILVPFLLLGLIGIIQYVRTRDSQAAKAVMRSWWAITLFFVCMVVSLVGQVAQNLQ